MKIKRNHICAKVMSITLFSVFIILSSCNNNTEINEPTNEDSLSVEKPLNYDEEINDIITLFQQNQDNNLIIDSIYIGKAEQTKEDKKLNGEQVNLLSSKFIDHEYTRNVSYDLTAFYMIDSLKNIGAYEDYVNSLDIGMMKIAEAYALDIYKLEDKKTEILIWCIKYSTYEACPYAAGLVIFSTILFNGEITSGAILAESMSAGDPPSGMSRNIFGNISSNGMMEYEFIQINEDEDENGIISDTTSNSIKYSIIEGKFKF